MLQVKMLIVFACVFTLVNSSILSINTTGLLTSQFQQVDRPLFIKFFVPWCVHCQSLAPTWRQLADAVDVKQVIVAEVDCTSATNICQMYGVHGYPTLALMWNSSNNHLIQQLEYSGPRYYEALVDFVSQHTASNLPSLSNSLVHSLTVLVLSFAIGIITGVAVFGIGTINPCKPPEAYSILVDDDPARSGHGPIHKSTLPMVEIKATSIYHSFQLGVQKNPNANCIGYRPILDSNLLGSFQWTTYREASYRIDNFAAGLKSLKCFTPLEGELPLMAIYMNNRPEWMLASLGIFRCGGIVVPLDGSLDEQSITWILNQTRISFVICALVECQKLIEIKGNIESLKHIIICGERDIELEERAKSDYGIIFYTMKEIEEIGAQHPVSQTEISLNDTALLKYSRDSTGILKGSMLSHQSQLVCANSFRAFAANCVPELFDRDIVYLSYLPVTHIFESFIHIMLYNEGASVAFHQGNPAKITDDLKAVQPTLFFTSSCVLNQIYEKISNSIESSSRLRKFCFNRALKTKSIYLSEGYNAHRLWDSVVFTPLRKKVGLDRCALIVAASTPFKEKFVSFLRVLVSGPVVECYGQLESGGVTNCSHAADLSYGTVGGPLPSSEMKLISVPDLGYDISDTAHHTKDSAIPCKGRGEVCVRGKQLLSGYYKFSKESQEAIDDEGWLHTGDIGLWTVDGKLKLIDQKKSIAKFSQIDCVIHENIENIISECQYVEQVYVHDDSFHTVLLAIIVPQEENLVSLAKELKIEDNEWQDLCSNSKIREYIRSEITNISIANKLTGIEIVKEIHLYPERFSCKNGLMMPNLKLNRPNLQSLFAKEFEIMYMHTEDAN